MSRESLVPFRKLQSTQTSFLKYIGLWEIDSSEFVQWLYFLYNKMMLTIICTFALTIFADMCLDMDDMSVTTDDGCVFAGIFVVIFKAMNTQFRRKQIGRLIDKIFECGEELCDFSSGEAKDIVDTFLLRNKVSFYGFSVLGFLLVVALLFFSPIQNGLPIRAKYPFDTTTSPWQQIAFGIEMCAVSGGMLAIVCIDSLTIVLCSLLILEFDILNMLFEKCNRMEDRYSTTLHEEINKSDDCHREISTFLSGYKRCLQFHQRLIGLLNDFNEIFSSSMFVQMLSSTSMICLTGFQAVVVGGQSSNIIKFGIYLSAAVSQLLYICWVGNELTYSSSLVGRSQWLSEWDSHGILKTSGLLILSMMFSRQSHQLKAGVFYVLSLETFIGIMRGSYSFFALLNNMHSSDER